MKIIVANLAGVKIEKSGKIRHFAKAGSRWPMTVGYSRSVDYYPFPFWLAYTTALLKRDTQAKVKGLDGVVMDLTSEEFLKIVKLERPDMFLCELTMIALKEDLKLLRYIKDTSKAKIAVTGTYATVYPERLLQENSFIDYILIAEYELTARELVSRLMHKESLEKVEGLVYRNKSQIKHNGRRPLISDLDALPYPDRYDFPATIYPDFTLYSPCISLIASRGCPAGCIFCTERHVMYNSPRYRTRSPKNVVDEMEFCMREYSAKQVYFDDMSFVVNRKNTMAICDEMIKRGLKVPWTCMGDAMFIDYGTLKKMAEAGCIGMKFGIESADSEILKTIGKPLNLGKAKDVVRWCKELGIRTHATFCLGLPGETIRTIEKTMKYMEELGADTSQVSKVVPYPGTPIYRWAKGKDYLITDDLSKYNGASKTILNYPDLCNEELNKWFEIFRKKVSRQKLLKYLNKPMQSLSIINQIWKQKGFHSVARSVWVFVRRAI